MSSEIGQRSRKHCLRTFEEMKSWTLLPKLYGCLFIDMPWMDMIFAFSCALNRNRNHQEVSSQIEELLGGSDRILISLSVRSSFDLFLQAMNFPPDSELISTCINIKQMSDIAKYHGVIVKPVDIDLSNLKPTISQIESLITNRTVGIMVVQLFGMKFSTDELNQVAKKHNLLLIEDCAQAFYGPDALHRVNADVAFFSFGSIKRFTCLGGACTVSNNPSILQRMRSIQNAYKVQGKMEYFYKLSKYVLFSLAMNNPFIAWFLSSLVSFMGIDYKVLVKSRLRSFTKGNLIEMIRYQPSMPLLLLLKRRMQALLVQNINMDACLRAEYAMSNLIEQPTFVVGCLSEMRDFWLFPVLVIQKFIDIEDKDKLQPFICAWMLKTKERDQLKRRFCQARNQACVSGVAKLSCRNRVVENDNPVEVECALEKLGISSFAKASSLEIIHKPSTALKASQFLCDHVLYLPIDRRVPKWHIDNVCRRFLLVLQSRRSIFDIAEQEGVELKHDLATFMRYSSGVLSLDDEDNSNDILSEVV